MKPFMPPREHPAARSAQGRVPVAIHMHRTEPAYTQRGTDWYQSLLKASDETARGRGGADFSVEGVGRWRGSDPGVVLTGVGVDSRSSFAGATRSGSRSTVGARP